MRRNGIQSINERGQRNANNRYPQNENRCSDNFELLYAQQYTDHCFNDGHPYQDTNFLDYFKSIGAMGSPYSKHKDHMEPKPRYHQQNYGLSTYNDLTGQDEYAKPLHGKRNGMTPKANGLQGGRCAGGYDPGWSYKPKSQPEHDFTMPQSTGYERGHSTAHQIGNLFGPRDWGQENVGGHCNTALNNTMWLDDGSSYQAQAYGSSYPMAGYGSMSEAGYTPYGYVGF